MYVHVDTALTSITEGVYGGVLISADFRQHFPEVENANVSGITASCFSLGAFVGCLFAFAFGDRLGRRWTIFIGMGCNFVGAVLQIASFQLPQMIVGRLINGFGMGTVSSTMKIASD